MTAATSAAVLDPAERARVEAAGHGCFRVLHGGRDSLDDRSGVVLFGPGREHRSAADGEGSECRGCLLGALPRAVDRLGFSRPEGAVRVDHHALTQAEREVGQLLGGLGGRDLTPRDALQKAAEFVCLHHLMIAT